MCRRITKLPFQFFFNGLGKKVFFNGELRKWRWEKIMEKRKRKRKRKRKKERVRVSFIKNILKRKWISFSARWLYMKCHRHLLSLITFYLSLCKDKNHGSIYALHSHTSSHYISCLTLQAILYLIMFFKCFSFLIIFYIF
jgi:hypothetical protein